MEISSSEKSAKSLNTHRMKHNHPTEIGNAMLSGSTPLSAKMLRQT